MMFADGVDPAREGCAVVDGGFEGIFNWLSARVTTVNSGNSQSYALSPFSDVHIRLDCNIIRTYNYQLP